MEGGEAAAADAEAKVDATEAAATVSASLAYTVETSDDCASRPCSESLSLRLKVLCAEEKRDLDIG